MKTILNKQRTEFFYPDCFGNDGRTITDKNDIADGFNTFYATIGIDLSSKIAPPLKDASIHDYLENRNTNSMFLSPTNEEEIISIIRTCNNKTSTDSNDISMNIVKKTIDTISKPLTTIFNMSFENGVFPCNMQV